MIETPKTVKYVKEVHKSGQILVYKFRADDTYICLNSGKKDSWDDNEPGRISDFMWFNKGDGTRWYNEYITEEEAFAECL